MTKLVKNLTKNACSVISGKTSNQATQRIVIFLGEKCSESAGEPQNSQKVKTQVANKTIGLQKTEVEEHCEINPFENVRKIDLNNSFCQRLLRSMST